MLSCSAALLPFSDPDDRDDDDALEDDSLRSSREVLLGLHGVFELCLG